MSIGRISTFRKTAHNMWALLKMSSCRHHETNSVGQPKMILYSGNSLIPRLSGHIVAYCSYFSGFVCELYVYIHTTVNRGKDQSIIKYLMATMNLYIYFLYHTVSIMPLGAVCSWIPSLAPFASSSARVRRDAW